MRLPGALVLYIFIQKITGSSGSNLNRTCGFGSRLAKSAETNPSWGSGFGKFGKKMSLTEPRNTKRISVSMGSFGRETQPFNAAALLLKWFDFSASYRCGF